MRGSNDKEIGFGSLHPRAARLKLAHAQDLLAYLEFARRAKIHLHDDTSVLEREIETARNTVLHLSRAADARIDPRRKLPRPVHAEHLGPRPEYIMFLDECGAHALNAPGDSFPVFCLCGVIVESGRYVDFDHAWKGWKAQWLGAESALIHEPAVRTRSGRFYDPDPVVVQARLGSLDARLQSLPLTCIAAAIDKRRLVENYPAGTIDDFLPRSPYLMCVDFIMERFTHFLHRAGGAQGVVRAESRGLREDAEIGYEYIRLHLEGTQFCADSQFRSYLRPSIQFERKDGNSSGLQAPISWRDRLVRKCWNRLARPSAGRSWRRNSMMAGKAARAATDSRSSRRRRSIC